MFTLLVKNLFSEIFILGILLWEIYAQQQAYTDPKFYSMQTAERSEFVKGGNRMDLPKKIPRAIAPLIHSCWAQDPAVIYDFE
jgi:hypothetical protein